MLNKLLVLVLLTLACNQEFFSQKYYFEKFSLEDGLPQNSVECIGQDSLGYLWVGTSGGISRFDGRVFKNFSTSEGLASNRVRSVGFDNQGLIWVGTKDGLSLIESVGEDFSITNYDKKTGLTNESVTVVKKINKDEMFVGFSNGNPVVASNIKSKNNLIFRTLNNFNPGLTAFDLIEVGDQYWFGTNQGLFILNQQLDIIKSWNTDNGLYSNSIRSLSKASDGSIWCAAEFAIMRFIPNGLEWDIDSLTKYEGKTKRLKHAFDIIVDSKSRVFACTAPFTEIKINDEGKMYFADLITEKRGAPSNVVQRLFEDSEGNIWLGSSSGGLARFGERKFELYNTDFGLPNNSIRQIVQDTSGRMWIGTGRAASRMNENWNRGYVPANYDYYMFETYNADKGVKNSSIWGMHADEFGNVWIGGVYGVHKWSESKIEKISDRAEFMGKVCMNVYEDSKKHIWLCTFEGTTVYNPYTDSLYSYFPVEDSLYGKRINSILEQKNGDLWFATSKGLYHETDEGYMVYNKENLLPDNYILSVKEDRNGFLWLATGSGVVKMKNEKTTLFNHKNGLSSDTPYLLQFDGEGNLWIGTNKGLDKFVLSANSEVSEIIHYGKEDGFMGIETNAHAGFMDRKGDLWFGTINGVLKYSKTEEYINKKSPKIHISSVEISYKPIPLQRNYDFEYDRNHLTIRYNGIDLCNSNKVRYKYKLEGFEEDWSPIVKRDFAIYSNLPPGSYVFKVLAGNGKVWASVPATMSIVIHPPFWATWWFRILSISTIIVLIMGVFKWRLARIKRHQALLESTVKQRTSELHVKNKELKDQNLLIEEQHKDITDSIMYAQRIQDAMIRTNSEFKEHFDECMIFFKPRDIVSGDFYWAHFDQTEMKMIWTVADCTGHGVPGAFMSMIGMVMLNQIIIEKGIRNTESVLFELRNDIIKLLGQSTDENENPNRDESKDGMDMSLCVYDVKSMKLQFSGAFNSMVLVRDGKSEIFRGDRQPVGPAPKMSKFSSHYVQLQEGDMVYCFTDGFPDQFGGDRGKKLKVAKFVEILENMARLKEEEQHHILSKEFDDWRGNYWQIDDVCVVGVRI